MSEEGKKAALAIAEQMRESMVRDLTNAIGAIRYGKTDVALAMLAATRDRLSAHVAKVSAEQMFYGNCPDCDVRFEYQSGRDISASDWVECPSCHVTMDIAKP